LRDGPKKWGECYEKKKSLYVNEQAMDYLRKGLSVHRIGVKTIKE